MSVSYVVNDHRAWRQLGLARGMTTHPRDQLASDIENDRWAWGQFGCDTGNDHWAWSQLGSDMHGE